MSKNTDFKIGETIDAPALPLEPLGEVQTNRAKLYFSIDRKLKDEFLVFLGETVASTPPEVKLQVLGYFTRGAGRQPTPLVIRGTQGGNESSLLYRSVRVLGRIDKDVALTLQEEGSASPLPLQKATLSPTGNHRSCYGEVKVK